MRNMSVTGFVDRRDRRKIVVTPEKTSEKRRMLTLPRKKLLWTKEDQAEID